MFGNLFYEHCLSVCSFFLHCVSFYQCISRSLVAGSFQRQVLEISSPVHGSALHSLTGSFEEEKLILMTSFLLAFRSVPPESCLRHRWNALLISERCSIILTFTVRLLSICHSVQCVAQGGVGPACLSRGLSGRPVPTA